VRGILKSGKPLAYGYMWWTSWTGAAKRDNPLPRSAYRAKAGYINPANNVVIAQTAA
jgi:hypothetical protein